MHASKVSGCAYRSTSIVADEFQPKQIDGDDIDDNASAERH